MTGRVNNFLWSLRKLRLPIPLHSLVLDVGSGSNPHPAADVLLEKYVDSTHRHGAGMIADRPTVLADACSMPFRDKSFDFVLAFHVLEHMPDPGAFLRELQRVGKAGYIETPNALFERLIPYDVHLLEIMSLDGTLLIHNKHAERPDPFLNELRLTVRSPEWHDFFYDHPALFHVRHLWQGEIRFQVINPEVDPNWFQAPTLNVDAAPELKRPGARQFLLRLIRQWYRRHKPPVDLDLLLACPRCHGDLIRLERTWHCPVCSQSFQRYPLPDFNSKSFSPSNFAGKTSDV